MTVKNLYKNKDEEDLLKLAETSAAETAAPLKVTGFDDSAYQERKPAYQSSYADRIDSLLSDLEERPAFRYEAESDPLYRQYRSRYQREGSRAVDDTLAEAAAFAGGMNSYAVTAAQQAGDYYNAQLMDRVPELAQLAYEMYQADYDADVQQLNLLREQEAEEYGRYQDSLSDWYAELEAAYRQYRDSVGDSQWQQNFDYQKAQDAQAYQQWLEQFNYGKEQDAIDNQYRQDAFDYEKAQDAQAYQQWLEQFNYGKEQDAIDNAYRQDAFDYEKAQDAQAYRQWLEEFGYTKEQDAIDNAYRQDAFDYTKEQDAIDNAYRQDAFDYQKTQDALAYEKWLREQALKYQSSRPEQEELPTVTAPPVEKDDSDDSAPAVSYTGTDYYQDAINAAVRGDRAAAEAALAKRAQKMASSAYTGNGGGTSMAAAQQYIESLLASSEDADISERAASGMLDKSEWKEKRASGSGVEASYATYEDYVSDYLRYLTER